MALFKRSQRTADIIKAYKHIFNSKEGQVVLYDLMNNSNFLRPTYSSKCPNVQTHLNEGKRELVLYILTKFQLNSNPHQAKWGEASLKKTLTPILILFFGFLTYVIEYLEI